MKRIILGFVFGISFLMLQGQNYIDGTLLYHNNPEYPIPEVEAVLTNSDGNFVASAFTNTDGYFAFEDVADGTYFINFSTDLDAGEVTMQDALSIVFYLAGIIDYTEIQQLAMDVNGNGNIGMDDFTYILIQHIIFGNPFPVGDWVFEEVEVNTNTREGDGSIGGSRTGDAEGVLVPTGRSEDQQYDIFISDKLLLADQTTWIPLNVQLTGQSVLGYVLMLDFDAAKMEVMDVRSEYGEVNFAVIGNQLRISWLDAGLKSVIEGQATLFEIQTRFKETVSTTDYFRIANGTQILDQEGNDLNYLVFEMPELDFGVSSVEVYPNPAVDYTNIKLSAEELSDYELKIYNTSGQLVFEELIYAVKGNQTKQISLSHLNTGMYQLVVSKLNGDEIVTSQKLFVK